MYRSGGSRSQRAALKPPAPVRLLERRTAVLEQGRLPNTQGISPTERPGVPYEKDLPYSSDHMSTMNYSIVKQSADEVRDLQNAPALSMSIYLLDSGQDHLRNQVSIYAERGSSRAAVRLLYMNDAALAIWREMGRAHVVCGTRHRPPVTAVLVFGVPHSHGNG
jgi:hypothetical protein